MNFHYAALEQKGPWRPIIFEGEAFPPTLMGISVLGYLFPGEPDDLIDWHDSIRDCRPTDLQQCRAFALRSYALMLEHRQAVLDGITERLTPHGFDVEITYRDWLTALSRIAELFAGRGGDCDISCTNYSQDYFEQAAWAECARRTLAKLAKIDESGNA